MIIIGSNALDYWIDIYRIPKDIDIIVTEEEKDLFFKKHRNNIQYFVKKSNCKYKCKFKNGMKYEIEIQGINDSSALILSEINKNYKLEINNDVYFVPTLDILLSLKMSSLNFNINWYKNMDDYYLILKYTNNYNQKIYEERKKEITERVINTNKSNDEFFNQSQAKIKRIYQHDSIHESIAYYDVPLFNKIKYDSTKAYCSKKLFNKLSFDDKIKCVKEEIFAIAIERFVLNSEKVDDSVLTESYRKSYEKICTTITSGWFREFAINNYLTLKIPDISYYSKFIKNQDKLIKIEH